MLTREPPNLFGAVGPNRLAPVHGFDDVGGGSRGRRPHQATERWMKSRPREWRRRGSALALFLMVLAADGAHAQGFGFGRGRGRGRTRPIRDGLPTIEGSVDRGFSFCRLQYREVRREANGQGWETDYPVSDRNLMTRFSQLTTATIARWEDGEPGHAVVRAIDDSLFECPFLFASDVGTMALTDLDIVRLRDYLLKGGFLWVDDFWGNRAWDQWASQILRILPEHTIVDVPPDHPLLSALYQVSEIPQVPSIQFWRRSGMATSERGRRERGATSPSHLREGRPPPGLDEPQHRHRRRVGA